MSTANRVPVLIPARNEAKCISRTLESLPGSVEPIVITNDCVDNTAEIAGNLGATVIKSEHGGKLLALQSGLRHLGSRALDTVLIIDADSQPISKQWHKVMERACSGSRSSSPRLVGGLVYFTRGIDPLSGLVYSLKPVTDANRNGQAHIRGANIAARIDNVDLLDQILELPNYWPGEESALVNTFKEYDAEVIQSLDPRAVVVTDGSRLTSIATRFIRGGQYTRQHFAGSYRLDASEGTLAYPMENTD